MARHIAESKEARPSTPLLTDTSIKRRFRALACTAGLMFFSHSPAAVENVASLLSPRLEGISLADVRKRLGSMECAIGRNGAQDCFVTMPFGATGQGSHEEARVFLRAKGGRIGQIIINGPVGQLTRMMDLLARHYGMPSPAASRVSVVSAPCAELSQWQREGRSVLVRVCPNPLVSGGGDFVVNVLADWYVLAAASR